MEATIKADPYVLPDSWSPATMSLGRQPSGSTCDSRPLGASIVSRRRHSWTALGYALLKWIQSLLPPFYFPPEANIAIDGRVLLFLAAATILTSIGFGLAPAIQASRRDSAESLKEGGRASSAGRGKLYARQVFIAAQVAATFILLVGSGLLIRSFQRLLSVDTGFESEGLIAAYLPLPMERNPAAAALVQYVNRIVEEVEATPGVHEAAVASGLPLRGWGDNMPLRMADKPNEPTDTTGFKIVTPGYLRALRLRLV